MEKESAPLDARHVARVLVLDEQNRVLLLLAADPATGRRIWFPPGGGLEDGEDFVTAAARELSEETGLRTPIGPWIWTRRHVFHWNSVRYDQYERIFVARTGAAVLHPHQQDECVLDCRWWSLQEIRAARDEFAPRRLASLLEPILRGEYPRTPINCGE